MPIRPATPDDATAIARIHVASWQTTYRGIVPDAYLDALSVERRAACWTRHLAEPPPGATAFVAETPGGIVGFADGGPAREGDAAHTGELYAIYLLAEHQAQGLGRQLFDAVRDHLHALGHPGMLLWVLRDNPSRAFYERLGGQPIRTKTVEIGGATLAELAYGFHLPPSPRWERVGVRADSGEPIALTPALSQRGEGAGGDARLG